MHFPPLRRGPLRERIHGESLRRHAVAVIIIERSVVCREARAERVYWIHAPSWHGDESRAGWFESLSTVIKSREEGKERRSHRMRYRVIGRQNVVAALGGPESINQSVSVSNLQSSWNARQNDGVVSETISDRQRRLWDFHAGTGRS